MRAAVQLVAEQAFAGALGDDPRSEHGHLRARLDRIAVGQHPAMEETVLLRNGLGLAQRSSARAYA